MSETNKLKFTVKLHFINSDLSHRHLPQFYVGNFCVVEIGSMCGANILLFIFGQQYSNIGDVTV